VNLVCTRSVVPRTLAHGDSKGVLHRGRPVRQLPRRRKYAYETNEKKAYTELEESWMFIMPLTDAVPLVVREIRDETEFKELEAYARPQIVRHFTRDACTRTLCLLCAYWWHRQGTRTPEMRMPDSP